MPDKRMETWASQLWAVNLNELTEGSDIDESVILCVSPQTRELVLGLLAFYGFWPNRWRLDEMSLLGSVPQETITDIVDSAIKEISVYMACESDFTAMAEATTRIAVAIEDWYDRSYIDFFDFKALLEASGLEGITFWLEAIEEIGDILGLIPDVNIKIPTDKFFSMMMDIMFRRRIFSKWTDTNALLQGMIVSESGPSASVIIDGIRDLIPLNETVDEILGGLDEDIETIPSALIALLTGNYVTNRVDDVAEAVKDLDGNLVTGIGAIVAKCEMCGGNAGSCACTPYGDIDPDAAPDEDGEPGIDPPPTGFDTWPQYYAYKCAAANRIVDEYYTSMGRLAALVDMVATLPPEAAPPLIHLVITTGIFSDIILRGYNTTFVSGRVVDALMVAAAVDPAILRYFSDLADVLEASKADVICNLFEATSPAGAAIALQNWQITAYDSIPYDPASDENIFEQAGNVIRGNLFKNVILNYLFEFDLETSVYDGTVDCDECESLGCTTFYSFDTDNEDWKFEDASSGGNVATGEWAETAGALQGAGDSGSGSGTARARWAFDLDSVALLDGTTITLRHSGPVDGMALSYRIGAVGLNGTQEALSDNQTGPGEFTLTLSGNDTYSQIWVQAARGAPSDDFETFFLDVCVTET